MDGPDHRFQGHEYQARLTSMATENMKLSTIQKITDPDTRTRLLTRHNQPLILEGDCVPYMRLIPENHFDAIVTDPPYGLKFMGKDWDDMGHGSEQQAWHYRWAVEALRVLKPGGHMLAFGGTRTYHRLVSAVEDAGFEIRDQIQWLYGTGFPKSHNVANAIDKRMGHGNRGSAIASGSKFHPTTGKARRPGENLPKYESRNPERAGWEGWGTALKPAHEPIVLARKPFKGTVAKNVLEHGTGGLNIDATRVITDENLDGGAYAKDGASRHDGVDNWRYKRDGGAGEFEQPEGRWPANIILDKESAAMLDEHTGEVGNKWKKNYGNDYADESRQYDGGTFGGGGYKGGTTYADSGGASRFFYCAKASRKERDKGAATKNTHPTVKPVELMRYLVRLVTPPEGIVLDPFVGSGTTGIAVNSEGFSFVGIDIDPDFCTLARARITEWSKE